jgi:uncharacterized protein (TIGR04255 family)
MSSNTEYIAKLSKAPLQEVIFEANWELDVHGETNQLFDPGYELAQGLFAEIVQNEFPVHKQVIPPFFPPQLLAQAQKPVHQFWKAERQWPVLQLGPGVLTVNDTEKNYVWESTFRPMAEKALDAVYKSYQSKLRFNKVNLRYIDAADFAAVPRTELFDFIRKNLQTRVEKDFEIEGSLSNLNVSQTYTLDEGSQLTLVISTGERNKVRAVVWQTAISKEGIQKTEEIKQWLVYSHSTISNLFKRMLRKEYYDSLR